MPGNATAVSTVVATSLTVGDPEQDQKGVVFRVLKCQKSYLWFEQLSPLKRVGSVVGSSVAAIQKKLGEGNFDVDVAQAFPEVGPSHLGQGKLADH